MALSLSSTCVFHNVLVPDDFPLFVCVCVCVCVCVQVIALLVLWQERRDGVRSSALFTIFWFCLVCYASLKLRTLILLAEDKVCVCV